MNYRAALQALSVRIRAIADSTDMHTRRMSVNSGDPFAQARRLLEQSRSILEAIRQFGETYKQVLPATAQAAIDRMLQQTLPLVAPETATGTMRQDAATAAVLQLTLFDSEIAYLLADSQVIIRSRCERAFEHLRRLIVVDPAQRKLWQDAHAVGEPRCESVGATALLLHGIWCFKTNAAGARTDLVYSEPIDLENASRAADGLVLTEWKRMPQQEATTETVNRLYADARTQAQRYAEGPLAGFELTGYRYLVVVSWHDIEVPVDIAGDGVLYRHINIPVAPLVPSDKRPRK